MGLDDDSLERAAEEVEIAVPSAVEEIKVVGDSKKVQEIEAKLK